MENMHDNPRYEEEVKEMVKYKVKKGVKIIFWVIFGAIAITALALLFGYVVMLLWNWLMPAIFGLGVLSFWQAVGLVVLAKIFFGGFGGGGGRSKGRSKRFGKKWESRLKKRCEENGFTKYQHYDEFWEEEGKTAYEAYLERKKSAGEESDSSL